MRRRLGCFNLHASLLPRWRGAAPINRAIMAGDAESGVMVMKMDVGLDTGDVAMAERIADHGRDDRGRSARCAGAARRRPDGARDGRAGARRVCSSRSKAKHGVTYAAKIDKAEARIDWNKAGARGAAAIFTGCRRFPARGARCRSKASRRASRSCAANSPKARARRANCSTIA